MNLRTLYILNGAVALLFALGLLLVTTTMLAMFGIDNTADTRLLAQIIGVELVAAGLSTLLTSGISDPKARSGLNYAHIAADALGLIIALNGTFTGAVNEMGFVLVLIYALLGGGFVYFQFFKPSM